MAKEEKAKKEAINALDLIQAGLPQGYQTTNKVAVRKRIQEIGRSANSYWTSWIKIGAIRGLAYLKENGIVKIIYEADFPKYLFNGKKVA